MDHFEGADKRNLQAFNCEFTKLLEKYFIRAENEMTAFKLSSFGVNRAVVLAIKTQQMTLRNEPLKRESDADVFKTRVTLDPRAWEGKCE